MPDRPDRRDLLSLFDFHVAAGVDCALDETPHDRFAENGQAAAEPQAARLASNEGRVSSPRRISEPLARPVSVPPRPSRATTASPDEAAAEARERAKNAATLAELEGLLAAFDGCALKSSAKTLVFADGNPEGRVMLVGEMPGADEDRVGKPFMGRSGQLLDRMLTAIGLDRSGVYIANLVPWRPPGNRNPTPQEIAICKPFVERQIELANPDILVCLGGPAVQNLLGTKDGILKSRGRWFPYKARGREIRALATLHPAYLLRQPLQKRLSWRDFRALRRALDGRE